MAKMILATVANGLVEEKVYEFDEDTCLGSILGCILDSWVFRIPTSEDREVWNDLIDNEWAGLDDEDYYSYNKPYINDDKWYCENNGYFDYLDDTIENLKSSVNTLLVLRDWFKIC